MKFWFPIAFQLYTSIKNALAKLNDKYTRYLPPAQYQNLVNSATGELTGVGLELLQQDDGSIKIANVEDDSPAQQAGILQGDILIDVDGTNTQGLAPEEVAVILR